jgi:hypothetical protein
MFAGTVAGTGEKETTTSNGSGEKRGREITVFSLFLPIERASCTGRTQIA